MGYICNGSKWVSEALSPGSNPGIPTIMEILRMTGFKLNPNDKIVNSLFKRIAKCNGECPCHHEEWNKETPHEDKLCPCKTYRDGGNCHCTLYVKEN